MNDASKIVDILIEPWTAVYPKKAVRKIPVEIAEHKAQQILDAMDRWISVEDRLPEDGERIDCYLEYASKSQWVHKRACNCWFDGRFWWSEDGDTPSNITGVVTHWQPLPPAPTKKSNALYNDGT